MDQAVEQILADLETRQRAEDELNRKLGYEGFQARRDEFLLCIGRASAQLLHILICGAKPKTILEIGTSYGFSTLWLADAARAVDARLITLDIHPKKQEHARAILTKAGLVDRVDFRLGDARQSIAALPGPFDFVLLDLWKDLYIPCFELCYPKLGPGAFVVADNMLFPEEQRPQGAQYRAHVRTKPYIDSILLPVGGGLELSRLVRDAR